MNCSIRMLAFALTACASVAHASSSAFAAGQASFTSKCALCHVVKPGEASTAGPNLHGLLTRTVASTPDFAYSDGLKAVGGQWTADRLIRFLQDPKAFAPGMVMPFSGLKSEKDRRNLACFLSGDTDTEVCR